MRRAFPAGVLCLLLGGCMAAQEPVGSRPQGSLESMLDTTSSLGGGAVRAVAPMATIPGEAGKITGIRQERSDGAQRQEIFLAGSVKGLTANRIEVLAVRSSAGDVQTSAAALPKPSEDGIRDEIAVRFPNLDMQVVARPMHNANGQFGLAIGKTAQGVRCVYAWQWIDSVDANRGRTSLGTLLHAEPTTAVSLRVSLCRNAATLDGLANAVERLSIKPEAIDPQAEVLTPSLEALAGERTDRTAAHVEGAPRKRRAQVKHRVRAARTARVDGADLTGRGAPGPAEPASEQSDGPAPARRLQPPSPADRDKPAARARDPDLPPQAYLGPSPSTKPARSGGGIEPMAATLAERP